MFGISQVARGRIAGLVSFCCLASASSGAQLQSPQPTVTVSASLGISTLPLWQGVSPEVAGANSESANLAVFEPQPGGGNGTAVIVAPGGAYLGLASNLEGRQVADWFAARGVTAFVLTYRLGAANPYPIPLRDAQRAVRLVRSLSQTYHLSPDHIGIMGFSAGGHLAAMEATSFDDGQAGSKDAVERIGDRPDFLILGYAWLGAMQNGTGQKITYCGLLHMPLDACKRWEREYTPAFHVSAKTPSTFLYATTDDALVPVTQSVAFYSALLNAHVPAEMHLFRQGAHGSGLGTGDPSLDAWPGLLEAWLRAQGWLTRGAETASAPKVEK